MKLEGNMEEMSVEHLWTIFKGTLINAAKQICGTYRTDTNRKQTAWWSKEIKEGVSNKKKAWRKYLANRNAATRDEYNKQRKQVKKMVENAKRQNWTEFGHKLERDSKGNQKLFFRTIKTLRKGKKNEDICIKNLQGEVLTDEEEIMNRWKEHFQELLQGEEQVVETEMPGNNKDRDREEEAIQMEEVVDAIKGLKNGKAPGADKITSEMLKNMGEKAAKLLLQLYNTAWRQEIIPSDWEVALILPIFKKGDSKQCNNYRGISLLCTPMKVFEKILDAKLRRKIEYTLHEAQSGFRKGRSVQDHVFTIKQITEKAIAQNNQVFLAFVDLEKAFDRVPRRRIWNSLENRGIEAKLIEVIKSLYRRNLNCVISKNMRSEMFQTNEGLRQGGGLSPLLFNIFMDDIINESSDQNKKLVVGYRHLQRITISEGVFADDVVVMAGNEKDLQHNLETWNRTFESYDMKINKAKTKVMGLNYDGEINISLEGTHLEQVNHFEYLGVEIENAGKQEAEINKRIEKAMKTYYAINQTIISKKEVSRNTKLNVYKSIFKPILTYGCESWVLTPQQRSKLQAAEMKFLRRIKGVTRRDRIRNTQIREELNIQPLMQYIEQKQLSWWGHLQRMESTRQVKKIWEAKVNRKRRRGRPRKSWDKIVSEILENRGTTWREAKLKTSNRKEWAKFVHQ
jgi:Reverse transcriptase (RNA-dependent DNA polymerase)